MALTLAIETSNPSTLAPGLAGEVALGEAEASVVEPVRGGDRHEDDLAAAIARVCGRAGVRAGDLKRIAVSIGPGGFTALRIAAATARMIAEAVGAETVAVPSADVVAAGVGPDVGRFAVALASKRGSAWVAVYERGPGGEVRAGTIEPGVMTAKQIGGVGPFDAIVADQHLDGEIAAWAWGTGVPVVAPVFSAAACLRLSLAIPPTDAAALVPLYPREPEAVTKWRELRGESSKAVRQQNSK